MGLDDGFSRGETRNICNPHLGKSFYGVRELYEGFQRPAFQTDNDQYDRYQYY